MSDINDLAARVQDHFDEVERSVFRGDGAANPRLKVEVLDAELVEDTPTLVLITPWTLNGMAFPPDDDFPDQLTIGKKDYPVFRIELEGLGRYVSVNLVPDVSNLQSPEASRGVARPLGAMFRESVQKVRQRQSIEDPARRRMFEGLRGE